MNNATTYREGKSAYTLAEGVVDLSDSETTIKNEEIQLPEDQVDGIEEGTILFSRTPLMGDTAMGYRVTGVEQNEGIVSLEVEEVDGTEVFSSYHMETGRQNLTISSVRAGGSDGGLIKENLLGDDGSRTVSLTFSPAKGISVDAKVTLSMYLDAEYNGDGLPTGYAILTKEIRVVSSVRYGNNLLDGEAAKKILEKTGISETGNKLLEVTFFSGGFYSIKGSASINVNFALFGSCDVTFTQVNGVYIDGLTYRNIEEPMTYTKSKDFNIGGSLSIGVSMDISLKVTGFGKIASFGGGMSVSIGVEQEEQYDENIICFDIPITINLNLGLSFRLGVGSEHIGFTFVEKKLPIFQMSLTLCTFHMELSKNENTNDRFASLEFMTECSIPEYTKLTFQFVTGTREKIKDQHTVYGQTISDPGTPKSPNERIKFLGWSLERDGTEYFDFSAPITADDNETAQKIKLYACWSEPMQKVTIDFQMEGREPAVSWYLPGSMVDPPVIPLRMYYRFVGYERTVVNLDGTAEKRTWDFSVNTVPAEDLHICGLWEYDPDYNPFDEIVSEIEEDEEEYQAALEKYITMDVLSTGVQATISPAKDETLSYLTSVKHITGYTGDAQILVIPAFIDSKPVVVVDGSNFANKRSLTGIVFPSTVLYVTGFSDCPNLQFVIFRDEARPYLHDTYFHGVRDIGKYAFMNCQNLEIVDFPANLSVIEDYAFASTGLRELTVPASVTKWGKYAFSACWELGSVVIPDGYNDGSHFLPEGTFSDCISLEHVEGLDGIYHFGKKSLYNTGFKTLSLKNVTRLQENALSLCQQLSNLNIEYSEGSQGYEGSLSDLPALVKLAAQGGFPSLGNNLPSLREIYVDETENGRKPNRELEISKLPALEMLEMDVDITDRIYIRDCPSLTVAIFRGLVKERQNQAFIGLYNLPALRTFRVTKYAVDALSLVMDNAGLQSLNLGDYDHLVSVKICNMANLTELIIPEGLDRSILDIRNNPQILDLNWRSKSCFVVPEYWTNLDDLNDYIWKHRDTDLRRVVFLGNPEINYNGFGSDTFVVASNPGSSIREYLDNGGTKWSHICIQIDMEEDKNTVFVQYRIKNNTLSLIIDNAEKGSTAREAAFRFDRNAALEYPPYVCTESGWEIEGWYLEPEFITLVAEGTILEEDMILYGKPRQAGTEFAWEKGEDGVIITGYHGTDTDVIVPEYLGGLPVIGIQSGAFSGQIYSLTLPESIQSLAAETFRGCMSLESVIIHSSRYDSADGLVYEKDMEGKIKTLIFCPAAKAGNLRIPEPVQVIAQEAGSGAAGIFAIQFPSTLEEIGERAFQGCSALSEVCFESDVRIAAGSFLNASRIDFYGPVEAPKLCAWADENGRSYNEYHVTFDISLANAPETLRAGTPLGDYVPVVREGEIFLGWAAGNGTEILTEMPAADTDLRSVWEKLSSGSDKTLTYLDPRTAPNAEIGREWTAIAAGAVDFDLDSLYIPSTVTMIDDHAFTGVIGKILGDAGSEAQAAANRLSIPFEEKAYSIVFITEPGLALETINGPKGMPIVLPKAECSWKYFTGWFLDESRSQPVGMNTMPGEDLVLYAGWTPIPGYSMDFNFRMETNGTVTILGYTGEDPNPLLPEKINGAPVTEIAPYAFSGDRVLMSLAVPQSVQKIGQGAFSNTALNRITFAGMECEIADRAFSASSALMTVTLPTGLTRLPARAFQGCSNLEKLIIPDSVTEIGGNAFDGCYSMDYLHLPGGLKTFSAACLGDCKPARLTVDKGNEYLAGNPEETMIWTADGETLLYVCRQITEISLSAEIKEIEAEAVADCRRLTHVEMPEGLQKIGNRAFAGCNALKEICLPVGISEVGEGIFGENLSIAIYISRTAENERLIENLAQKYTVIAGETIIPATGIRLNVPESMSIGETGQASAVFAPANATDQRVIFSSSDEAVMKTTEDGKITGTGIGEAVLMARTPGGLWAEATVRVGLGENFEFIPQIKNPYCILDDGTPWILPGGKYYIQIDKVPEDQIAEITVAASQDTVTITGNGTDGILLTRSDTQWGIETLKVTVRLKSGHLGEASLSVFLAYKVPAEMPQSIVLYEGDEWICDVGSELECEPYDSLGLNRLLVSNPAVAKSEGSRVVAIKSGFCRVRYSFAKAETCVIVMAKGCDLNVSLKDNLAYIGHTAQIVTECSDPLCEIRYSSDNPAAATVSETGVVKGVVRGPANITVSAFRDGVEMNRRVLKIRSVNPVIGLNLEDVFYTSRNYQTGEVYYRWLELGEKKSLFSKAGYISYDKYDKQSVEFTSSNPDVISIDENGYAFANQMGKATITALYRCTGDMEEVEVVSDVFWNFSGECSLESKQMTVQAGKTKQMPQILHGDVWYDWLQVTWEADEDEDCFVIDENGYLTGLKETEYKKTVYVNVVNSVGYAVYQERLEVTVEASGIEAVPASSVVRCHELMAITFLDPDGKTIDPRYITLYSLNSSIVEVVNPGIIIGRNLGSAALIAQFGSGPETTIHITVSGEMHNLRLPEGMKRIESEAFAGDNSINAVRTGAEYIGEMAFANCTGLRYIILENDHTEIDETAFVNCESDFFLVCNRGSQTAVNAEAKGWKVLLWEPNY